jgi:hypothetical protein
MKKIADNIIIDDIIKTDFILDVEGKETSETYQYKEYFIVDVEGNILETGRYIEDNITIEDICERTGIKLGYSYYVFN